MKWFKKKEEPLPNSFTYGKEKITVFRSWKEVPFNIYLKWLNAETVEERLRILTTVTPELLKDGYVRQSMENMTIWSLVPPQPTQDLFLVFDEQFYSFPKDIDLLKHTYDQFKYVDVCMQPVYDLVAKLSEENGKEVPDAVKIAKITEEQSKEVINIYANLIAAYCNVAKGDFFDSDKVEGYYVPLINELDTVTVNTLGSFFLSSSMELKTGR